MRTIFREIVVPLKTEFHVDGWLWHAVSRHHQQLDHGWLHRKVRSGTDKLFRVSLFDHFRVGYQRWLSETQTRQLSRDKERFRFCQQDTGPFWVCLGRLGRSFRRKLSLDSVLKGIMRNDGQKSIWTKISFFDTHLYRVKPTTPIENSVQPGKCGNISKIWWWADRPGIVPKIGPICEIQKSSPPFDFKSDLTHFAKRNFMVSLNEHLEFSAGPLTPFFNSITL